MSELWWRVALAWLAVGCVLAAGPDKKRDKRPGVIQAPADDVEFPPRITGRGAKMNYGPFLTYSVIHCPGKGTHLTPKAITVRAGRKPFTAVCFDPESLRVAAAWTGGYLDIARTNLNGYKGGDLAHELRPLVFSTRPGPGWAGGDGLKGPACKYRGLYLHGEQVIFSYAVGKTEVLEAPGALGGPLGAVVTRAVRVGPHDGPLTMLVCEAASEPGKADRASVVLQEKDEVVAVVGRHLPEGAALKAERGRVALALPAVGKAATFQVLVWRGAKSGLEKFRAAAGEETKLPDLPSLCKGGPPRWRDEVKVAGKRAADTAAYVVDDVPLPAANPWGSWMRPGAFDFFDDGRAAVCTWNGDVWVASGLDEGLKEVRWRRFATGLFEPLGLKVVGGKVYALGRDRITRLHDLNGDGEADFYESFNADAPAAPTFHDFAMELHTDSEGNFYYSRGGHRVKPGVELHGGIVKVSKDGSKSELFATGFREANGMCVGPGDVITVADNQGNWVPSAKIDVIKPGGFYGYNWGKRLTECEKPLCWVPHKVDNSCGGQAWVTSDKWGPFRGQMLHTSYGACKLFLVMHEKAGGVWQGGVCEFPLNFSSGIMRARFSPKDGQLYVCGLKGWGSKAKTDGCFQRVRYTGKTAYLPKGLRVGKGELRLEFACELDGKSINPGAFAVERWNYAWTGGYGSKEYSVAQPRKVGRDKVAVAKATLSADRKTVTLSVPDLAPVMQMGTTVRVKAADGSPVSFTIYNTINRVP